MKAIKLFWEWIYYNERTLRNLRSEKPAIQKLFTYWLDRHLHNYSEGLECIFLFPTETDSRTQLVITSNGKGEYFANILELVKHAPEIANWNFVSFIQPANSLEEIVFTKDQPYIFKDITLKPSDLMCLPFSNPETLKVDVIVYLKNYTAFCNNKNLLNLIYIILQDMVVDDTLFEKINFVELAQFNNDDNWEIIHLYELEFYLEEVNKSKLKALI